MGGSSAELRNHGDLLQQALKNMCRWEQVSSTCSAAIAWQAATWKWTATTKVSDCTAMILLFVYWGLCTMLYGCFVFMWLLCFHTTQSGPLLPCERPAALAPLSFPPKRLHLLSFSASRVPRFGMPCFLSVSGIGKGSCGQRAAISVMMISLLDKFCDYSASILFFPAALAGRCDGATGGCICYPGSDPLPYARP